MPGMNKMICGGYVAKDPEIRTLNSGDKVANLSIPTSEKWTDKTTGEKREETTWHNIVCFNPHICEVIEKYVVKGSIISVVGQIRNRKWTDQSGVEKYSTEVVIPRFGGELHLMGEAKSSGAGRDDQYADEQQSRYGTRETGVQTGSVNDTGQGDSRGGEIRPLTRQYGDIDDDIPF